MYKVYILKSLVKDWYYIGHTSDIKTRIKSHNSGKNKSTKHYKPFKIVYFEVLSTKSEAFKREMQIKRYRHGEAFLKLVNK